MVYADYKKAVVTFYASTFTNPYILQVAFSLPVVENMVDLDLGYTIR